MAFGLMAIIDSFGDTEGPPMTGWATPSLAAGLRSASGVCLANAINAIGIWNTILAGADCEAYVTVPTAAASGGIIYVFARAKETASAATLDGYSVSVTEAATDTWAINLVTNGGASAIGATFTQEVANGDAIGIRCVGSDISAWYKASGGSWTQLATRSDSTYAAAGYIGLGLADTTARLDDFGGGVATEGAASITLGILTTSASSALAVKGQSSIALGVLTTTATGALPVVGQAAITLSALTTTSTGALSIAGQAALTLGVLTSTAISALTIAGQASIALGALTTTATGALPIVGQADITLGALTVIATGELAGETIGQADITLDVLTIGATGALSIAGQASVTLGELTAVATCALSVAGRASIVLSELSTGASGVLAVSGQTSITFGELVTTATGLLAISGQALITLDILITAAIGGLPTPPRVLTLFGWDASLMLDSQSASLTLHRKTAVLTVEDDE